MTDTQIVKKATHIRLQYKETDRTLTWKNSSLTAWAAASEQVKQTARALAVQNGWYAWRIVPHQP